MKKIANNFENNVIIAKRYDFTKGEVL